MSRRTRHILPALTLLAVGLTAGAIYAAIRPPSLSMRWAGAVLVALLGSLGVYVSRHGMKRLEDLEEQSRGLTDLGEAARKIQSELELDTLLQAVTDEARRLLGARYGALSIADGQGKIERFITSGLPDEARQRIGAPPSGQGLLAVPLRGKSLRIAQMHQDSRSVGFPEHHPPMDSLLAVPVPTKSAVRANLYLTDKLGRQEFSDSDLASLGRFAASAASAIDNSNLLSQKRALAIAEERVRISREMHDGMAQILGYVNNKAQAAQAYLERNHLEQASAQLEQLITASRELSADVREGIAALRTEVSPDQPLSVSLDSYLQVWRDRSGIPVEVEFRDEPLLPPEDALQILRIVQESLTNIRRHAQARSVLLTIHGSPDELTVSIQDDGRGFDPERTVRENHYGLSVMKERAQSIGASLDLRSSPGQGTTVELTLPVEHWRSAQRNPDLDAG